MKSSNTRIFELLDLGGSSISARLSSLPELTRTVWPLWNFLQVPPVLLIDSVFSFRACIRSSDSEGIIPSKRSHPSIPGNVRAQAQNLGSLAFLTKMYPGNIGTVFILDSRTGLTTFGWKYSYPSLPRAFPAIKSELGFVLNTDQYVVFKSLHLLGQELLRNLLQEGSLSDLP